MKKIQLLCLALLSIMLLDSCATKLPMSIKDKTALFCYRTAEDAAEGDVNISTNSGNPLIWAVELAGSGIADWKVEDKLRRCVNEDSLASALSEGMEESAQELCKVRLVHSLEDKPELIFETEVLEYALISDEGRTGLRVLCKTRLIQREEKRQIWEKEETRYITFKETGFINGGGIGSAISGVINLKDLLDMPDEEVKQLMYTAAFHAGEALGEELQKVCID